MNSADLLTKRAYLTPDREALYDAASGVRYTYAELNQRASRAANFLRETCGVEKGDRVSILAHNHIAYVDLLFGLGKIGAVFAPLNWRLTSRELTYIVNDCQPKVLIVGPEFVSVYEEMKNSTNVEHVVALEEAEIGGVEDYEGLLVQASAEEPKRPFIEAEDAYCILYTSGTTGRPKGAILPHRQILWNAINTVISWGLSERDVSPILTPMFHSGGLFVFLVPLFYAGGRIVLARTFDADESLKLIVDEKCTVILGVPTLFQVWMNSPQFETVDFSHVHFFISGGAPCPPSLIEAWSKRKGVTMRQGYGLTEVGVNCFSMTDEDALRKVGSVGKPIFHSEMRLVDENGNDVPVGETGELIIKGPHVCVGYWNNEEATRQSLKDGPSTGSGVPWFHTGDMARMDDEGYFYIVGRFKDMIISGGENVYAAEVEAVFREHEAVADAALIGQPDEKWGEVGLMIVARKPNQNVSAEELLQFCTGRLAKYKLPKRIEFVESLPYSPYGKVMKAELRKRFVEDGR
ncbi:MAG: long-chain fatty acid--CoA ligase [Anaerolineales bacterium]|nr:long-chain fatty acid--CoA ligase [Anaerolineales bacterium]